MMDSLLSLRVFAAGAELRGFAAAAGRLKLSAAMAGKHRQKLEKCSRRGCRNEPAGASA